MFTKVALLRRSRLLVAAAALGFIPASASADGITINKQDIVNGKAGAVQRVFSDPSFFGRNVNAAWAAARPGLETLIKNELGKGDRFGRGFTLYNINLSLARSGPVEVKAHGAGAVLLTYRLNGNHISVTSTVPGPTPKSWDPTIHVDWDMHVMMVVSLPRPDAAAKVTWVGANIDRVSARSKSVIVNVAKFFIDSFVKGGTRGILQNAIRTANSRLGRDVDIKLGQPTTVMANLKRAGYTGFKSQVLGSQVVLTLTKSTTQVAVPFNPNAKINATTSAATKALSKSAVQLRPATTSAIINPADRVSLNPQPLPPKDAPLRLR